MTQHRPFGIIFDLDGTLVDTLADITLSVNELLGTLGKLPLSVATIRSYVGEGLANLLQRASGLDAPDEIAALVAKYRPIYRRRMFDLARLYPGVSEALDVLAARGHSFCILSNKSHDFIIPFVERLLGRWSWVEVCGLQAGVPRKPDPAQALRLSVRMDREPCDVIFVGDSAVDMRTARDAGMKSIGVTWGYRDRAELISAEAGQIIDHAAQLCAAVDGISRAAT